MSRRKCAAAQALQILQDLSSGCSDDKNSGSENE